MLGCTPWVHGLGDPLVPWNVTLAHSVPWEPLLHTAHCRGQSRAEPAPLQMSCEDGAARRVREGQGRGDSGETPSLILTVPLPGQ